MSQWKEYKLDDIVSKLGDGLHGTPKYDPNGDYYFINGSNLIDGNISVNDSTKKVTIEEFNKYKKELNDRTILVSINGTLGNVAVYDNEKVVLGKSACYFNVKETFNKEFLRYVITDRTFQNYIIEQATGTTIKNVPLKAIREFVFKAPDYPTQTAIASILSSLDEKIELNNAINRNLEALAQALFKQWFVDFNFPVDEHGNFSPLSGEMSKGQRGYKYSGGELVESELGMIPKGWEIKKIAEVCDVTDYVANGSFASLAENVKYKSEKDYAILIRLTDYNRNYNGDFVFVDESAYNFLNKSKIFGGEIIIANVGANAGTVFRAPYFDRPMTLGPNSIMIKNNVFINYLYQYLISTMGQYMISGIISGSAQPKFNKTDFRKIELIVPSMKVVKMFNELYTSLNDNILLNVKQTHFLIELRDTLLPKLISGEIEVKEALSKPKKQCNG